MHRILHLIDLTPGATVGWSEALTSAGIVLGLSVLSLAVLVRFRRSSISASAAILGVILISIVGLLSWRTALVGPGRAAVLAAMAQRPDDPWPRGSGHAPLGVIGAAQADKGYIEPGGGFSPSVGSFGVAFWVMDSKGRRLVGSEDYPLARTHQAYVSDAPGAVRVRTPAYDALWRVTAPGRAALGLADLADGRETQIVLRGVGPAGGPLWEIVVLDTHTLLLNRRWEVRAAQPLDLAFLGREYAGWVAATTVRRRGARSPSGWASVRLRVPRGGRIDLEIHDREAPPSLAASPAPGATPGLPGRDPRFDASALAQIATLEQSIIGDEIAPADPTNYPLPWLRDGAYVLVALARAGDTERLRALAMPLAKRDFFGGFGAEADAPGLALWALGEASVALDDPAFDAAIWPHVARKVGIIQTMLHSGAALRADYSGPIVPAYRRHKDLRLVAEPARDGLIYGRMDWGRPVYYVNAVSHAGLRRASDLAARLGHEREAQAWAASADQLGAAWRKKFAVPGGEGARRDDRTAISGLWPGDVADPILFKVGLERRWSMRRNRADAFRSRPLWTYFDVAEAHQWLRLGRPERAWATLDWFWDHQPAPGLYTLWEGKGEENNFGLWKQVRGWVKPPNVTPHAWAAAEMLLLQLAMLAEVEGHGTAQVLRIGGGVPANWLAAPFCVARIGTAAGPVSWCWTGCEVAVTTRVSAPVRLGPAFPAGTPVTRRGP